VTSYHDLASRVRARIGQQHRYEHSVRVARCAELLAMRHGGSPERARIAGMLHDLARLWPAQRLLDEAARRGYASSEFERCNPVVLHAPLSALLAAEEFGVRDEEILAAIACHTLAAPNMAPLAMMLYLADALEPGRNFADRAALWELAQHDLHEATGATIQSTLKYAATKNFESAPQTIAALESLLYRKREARTVQIA